MKDCSDYNKVTYDKRSKVKVKIRYNTFIIITIVLYAVFYSLVTNGQNEGKLFIQQHVLLDFDVEKTSLIIGAVICASRIIRVLSNIVFAKLYGRYKDKMGIILPLLLCSAMGFMLFGSFVPQVMIKILVMAMGYTIILFVRDPFRLYIQDILFENTAKELHQTLLTVLEFGVKIAMAGMGLAFSAILVSYPMILVIFIMFAIAVIEVILGIRLYREILIGKKRSASN